MLIFSSQASSVRLVSIKAEADKAVPTWNYAMFSL
jgi:predicted FMN-binding regulatory protein PaiB